MLTFNILATKLHRPPHPATWVQRPYLSQRLYAGLQLKRQMTLVSAPAGFGKTTCVIEWADSLDRPLTWLSLDPGDDDPNRFFTYFVAALQKVDAALGREIETVLQAGQLPPAEVIATNLSNDILQLENQFLFVLDDFHVIQDPAILLVIEKLITNPPAPLHLVLITREDPPLPLARLRAHNRLTEIRAQDLRFTNHDTQLFFDKLGLSLAQSDMSVLEDKTEGWIAGLQLAAIALQSSLTAQDDADPSAFIANLSGSHRFILSYLTEQVLDQQPKDIRQFLLQTAILDKLHGDLCDAVTGRSDGRLLLEHLLGANLFIIPLDGQGQWYRYHHLFADLLRDRQQALLAQDTAVRHQRAAHWYAQREMAAEAIQHALAAADYGLAVTLLEGHALRLITQGYVKTVNGWVQQIPERWQSQSPRTNLALAWMHLLRGAYAQAAPFLERLRSAMDDFPLSQLSADEAALKAEWLVLQSLLFYMEGEATQSEALAEQALALAPDQDGRVRSLAYYALASVYQLRRAYDQAVESYQLAVQHGRAADNVMAEMLSTIGLAMMAFEHGRLHLAFDIAAPFDERWKQAGSLPPISAVVYGVLGEVCLQWDQLQQARYYIERSLQLSRLGGINTGVIFGHVTLSRLAQIEGDLELAAREIQTAVDLLPLEHPAYIGHEVAAQQVNLNLARRRPEAAQMVLQGQGFSFDDRFVFPDLAPEPRLSHALGLLYNSSLRLLLHLARSGHGSDRLKAGIELAAELIAAALTERQIPIALETTLLRAQMDAALGDHQAAQADYKRALQLAEPEGFIAIFVEQGRPAADALAELVKQNQLESTLQESVTRILAAFSRLDLSQTTPEAPPLIEPLSDREVEVLRLMASGLKYKEIADQLFISLNTVRYHVKALYGKLNVNNRTQAIAAARRQHIL